MNTTLEKYLNTVDRHLKPLQVSERVDIVKEIKSSMIEMENEQLSPQEIIDRLGAPKELARAYLGDLITSKKGVSWNKFLCLCAFYSLVGLSGVIIIPALAIIAPVFTGCAFIAPILAAVKLANYLFHLGIPYMEHVGIVLSGIVELNPVVEFLLTLIVSALLYWAGRGAWKLMLFYIKSVSRKKEKISAAD